MLTIDEAKKIAQKYFSQFSKMNNNRLSYLATDKQTTPSKYGWIFVAEIKSNDPALDPDMLGGSTCILVNKFDEQVYSLWYFGDFDKAIEKWEKQNPNKVIA